MPFKHNGRFGNHWEWEEPARPGLRDFCHLPAYYLDNLWFPRNSGLVLQATRLVGSWIKTLLLALSLLAILLLVKLFLMVMSLPGALIMDDDDGTNPLLPGKWPQSILNLMPSTPAPAVKPCVAVPATAPVVVDEWPELTAKEAMMGRPRQYPPPPEPKPYSPNHRSSPDFSVARQDFFKEIRQMSYLDSIREEQRSMPSWRRRDVRRDDTPEHVKQAANLQYNLMCVSVEIEHKNANSFGVGPYLSHRGMENLQPMVQFQRTQAIQQAAQSLQHKPRVAFQPYQQQQQFGASNQVFVGFQNRPDLLNELKSFGKEIRDLLPQIHFAIENGAWMTQSAKTADLTRDYLSPALLILGQLSPGIRKQEVTTIYWPMEHLHNFQAWLSGLTYPDAVDTETMRILDQLLAVFQNAQQEADSSNKGVASGIGQFGVGSQHSQQPQAQQWQQQQQGSGHGGIFTGTHPAQQPPTQSGGYGITPPNTSSPSSTLRNLPNDIGTLTPIQEEDEPASPSTMPADKREFLTVLIRDIYGEIKTLYLDDNDPLLEVSAGRALEGRCAKAVTPLFENAYTGATGKPWMVSKQEAGDFGEWCIALHKAMVSSAYRGPLKRKYSQKVKDELEQVGKALNLGFGPSNV